MWYIAVPRALSHMCTQVHVNVTVDSELDVVENELDKNANGLVSVEQGGGTSFSLKLKPRSAPTYVHPAHAYFIEHGPQ